MGMRSSSAAICTLPLAEPTGTKRPVVVGAGGCCTSARSRTDPGGHFGTVGGGRAPARSRRALKMALFWPGRAVELCARDFRTAVTCALRASEPLRALCFAAAVAGGAGTATSVWAHIAREHAVCGSLAFADRARVRGAYRFSGSPTVE